MTKHYLIAPITAILAPYLSRLPRGSTWVYEYFSNHGEIPMIFINLVIVALFSVPGIVIFMIIKKENSYIKVTMLYLILFVGSYILHGNNDLSNGIASGVRLLVAPVLISILLISFNILFLLFCRADSK